MGPGDHGAQAAQIVRNLDAALAAVGRRHPPFRAAVDRDPAQRVRQTPVNSGEESEPVLTGQIQPAASTAAAVRPPDSPAPAPHAVRTAPEAATAPASAPAATVRPAPDAKPDPRAAPPVSTDAKRHWGPLTEGLTPPPATSTSPTVPAPWTSSVSARRSPPLGQQGQRSPARAGRRAPGELPPRAAARPPHAHHGRGGRAPHHTPRPPHPRHRRLAHRPARRPRHASAARRPLRPHHTAGHAPAHRAPRLRPRSPLHHDPPGHHRAHAAPAPAEPAAPAHHRQTAPAPRQGRGR